MSIVKTIKNCRLCHNQDLVPVISLGEQYITSRFPVYGDFSTPKTPIDLCRCRECGLLQLLQTTFSSELYEYEYGYRSGISNTMREHLKNYHLEILSKISFTDGDMVVDIGSNDSTLLQYYSPALKRIGVDPTGKQFLQYYGDVELVPTYFTYDNFTNVHGKRKAKVVTSISMFYDLPDPVQFANDIFEILEQDGIWTCEQSYMPTMIETNSLDTICHEHLEYYALTQVKNIADRAGFKIIDVKFNDCNGGSFRVYFAKRDSTVYEENVDLIHSILQKELDMGILSDDIYKTFMENCDREINRLRDFVGHIKNNGKTMYIYGASTKGNCLLQYANLGESDMKYAVERNPKKVGKMTNTGIEIISEETMRESPPDYLLVLPWHFRKEIVERESAFLNQGGQLVFPFPKFEIVSRKPIALITGCDGFIANYVKKEFQDFSLYGIGRSATYDDKTILKYQLDMKDNDALENAVCSIRPTVLIHLAGISSSQHAFRNPVDAVETNGMLTAKICDIIHRNGLNTKFFNASSSEIYKGHLDYEVQENDRNLFHSHPYSIAKILGHSMVDFYRNTHGLPFSNGIIFTTESSKKRPEFLLNKVANHIRNWKQGRFEALTVGNLDSKRNILHASDVASAIRKIIDQDHGDNYLICGDESSTVRDLVMKMYEKAGLKLENREGNFYEVSTGNLVLCIDETLGVDSARIHIRGESKKLKAFGWVQKISVEDILNEFVSV
jgi:NDP-4-keto-2,6-dideoxyhexose 3-C-methyltransferase